MARGILMSVVGLMGMLALWIASVRMDSGFTIAVSEEGTGPTGYPQAQPQSESEAVEVKRAA